MRNYKFRLSDMIPNAWFYKLKAMSHNKSNKNQNNTPQSFTRSQQPPRTPKPLPFTSHPKLLPNRASHYFSSRAEADGYSNHVLHSKVASDAELLLPLDPLRRSTKTSRRKPKKASPSDAKLVTSSVSAACGCRAWKEAESITEFLQPASACYVDDELPHSQETDVAGGLQLDSDINVRTKSSHPDTVPERELPPIKTKPAKKEGDAIELEHKISDDKTSSYRDCGPAVRQNKSHTRRSPPGLHRLRMRACSPQLVSRKLHAFHGERTKGRPTPTLAAMQQQKKKRVSGSFAVVKSSSDPQKDFRDSMVEMITENNMRTSKDLEELLVCYLLLNSKEYHDLIMEVFEQLWIDLITKR